VGHPHVDKQITAVTTLLRATPDGQWNFFRNVVQSGISTAPTKFVFGGRNCTT
jgi:hypothetical protein